MKNFDQFLNETSLSRVFQHFKSDRPILVVTAFRGDKTYKENVRRNKALAAMIKKAGYGYVFVDGHWVEKDGNNETDTSEDSIFVIGDVGDNGKLKGLAKKWMKEYNQDAVLFKDEGGKEVSLIFQDGKTQSIGTFRPNKIAQAYTKLRGRAGHTFVFENAAIEKNWIGKLGA